jgi:hypothetical protein
MFQDVNIDGDTIVGITFISTARKCDVCILYVRYVGTDGASGGEGRKPSAGQGIDHDGMHATPITVATDYAWQISPFQSK